MDFIGLALLLCAGLLLLITLLTAHTVWILTHPPRRGYSWAVARGVAGDPAELRLPGASDQSLTTTPSSQAPSGVQFTEWTFQSRARALPVWDIAGLVPSGPVAIFTHGWGDSRVVALSRVPALLASASRVLLWDLPGHGEAPGACSLGVGEVEDLRSLIQVVQAGSDRSADPSDRPTPPIVLAGFSLGAGISIMAAAAENTSTSSQRSPVIAVIAEAPYCLPITPARNMLAMRSLPWRINLPLALALLGFRAGQRLDWAKPRGPAPRFDRSGNTGAPALRVPLLILHGTEDAICPLQDSLEIAAAAPAGAEVIQIPGATHNSLWTNPEHEPLARASVVRFIRALTPLGEQTSSSTHSPAREGENARMTR